MFIKKHYPEDIAEALCKAAQITPDEKTSAELEDAIYAALARAENEYNSDYHRTLYRLLEQIADVQGVW